MKTCCKRCSTDPSEHIRAWAIRLLCDGKAPGAAVLGRLAELARNDPSPKVRLGLASALQRIPIPSSAGRSPSRSPATKRMLPTDR